MATIILIIKLFMNKRFSDNRDIDSYRGFMRILTKQLDKIQDQKKISKEKQINWHFMVFSWTNLQETT